LKGRKTMKKVTALFLSLLLLLASVALPVYAAAGDNDASFKEPTGTQQPEGGGLTFSNLGTYAMESPYSASPRTVETEILFPQDFEGEGGVILSNGVAGGNLAFLTLSVREGGVVQLKYMNRWGSIYTYAFEDVNVCTGKWVHLSVVLDGAGEVRCYIDGALKATMTDDSTEKPFDDCHPDTAKKSFFVGGDATEHNPNYFRGAMKSLAVFDSVRTHAQILSDAKDGVDADAAGLLSLYSMKEHVGGDDLKDLSGNKNDVIANLSWYGADAGAYAGEFDFSLAVVGDTQTITNSYPASLKTIYQWIVDSKEEKKIQYALGLGDITEVGVDEGHRNYNPEKAAIQWSAAKEAIRMMDGILPYSLIRGDGHDGVEYFNEYFADHEGYTENIAGYCEEGRIENVYHTFTVGETDYMILCLDFGAKDPVLAWASGVVEAHPDHRVIVTTHGYMEKDGTHLTGEEDYAPSAFYYDPENNDGDDIWNKFVSKHENIFMILSGHMSADEVVIHQRVGDHGNIVTEMLIDPQDVDRGYAGGTGMVAMLYFSGEKVAVEYYSTVQKAYKPLRTFEIDRAHTYTKTVVPPVCGIGGYTLYECSCGDVYRADLTEALTHEYDGEQDTDCNLCGEVRKLAESEQESESITESESESAPVSETASEALGEGSSESTPIADGGGANSDGGGGNSVLIVVVSSVAGGALVIGAFALLRIRKKK